MSCVQQHGTDTFSDRARCARGARVLDVNHAEAPLLAESSTLLPYPEFLAFDVTLSMWFVAPLLISPLLISQSALANISRCCSCLVQLHTARF